MFFTRILLYCIYFDTVMWICEEIESDSCKFWSVGWISSYSTTNVYHLGLQNFTCLCRSCGTAISAPNVQQHYARIQNLIPLKSVVWNSVVLFQGQHIQQLFLLKIKCQKWYQGSINMVLLNSLHRMFMFFIIELLYCYCRK